MSFGSVLVCAYFNNGDGVLVFKDPSDQKYKPQRLLLTDSGHYLLPIDNYNSKSSAIRGIGSHVKKITDGMIKLYGKESPSLFSAPSLVYPVVAEEVSSSSTDHFFQ